MAIEMMSISHCYCSDYMTKPTQFGDEPQIVVSLHPESKPAEDMARKQKESEKSAEVLALEARIRELELQNLALNTLIDVAERNGIEIRKKSGAKQ